MMTTIVGKREVRVNITTALLQRSVGALNCICRSKDFFEPNDKGIMKIVPTVRNSIHRYDLK